MASVHENQSHPQRHMSYEWCYTVVAGDVSRETFSEQAIPSRLMQFDCIPMWGLHVGGCVWYPDMKCLMEKGKYDLTATHTLFIASRSQSAHLIPGDSMQEPYYNPETRSNGFREGVAWRVVRAWCNTLSDAPVLVPPAETLEPPAKETPAPDGEASS